MSEERPIIYIKTSPEHVVAGNLGDIFYRNGDLFIQVDGSTNKWKKLDHKIKNFIGDYKHPIYKGKVVMLEHQEETWVKVDVTPGTKTGWQFAAPRSPFIDTIIGTFPTPTPTPSMTPTPTSTAVPTPTPTMTPTPTLAAPPKLVVYTGSFNFDEYINSISSSIDTTFLSVGYISSGSKTIQPLSELSHSITSGKTSYEFPDIRSTLNSISLTEYPIDLVASLNTTVPTFSMKPNVRVDYSIGDGIFNVADAYVIDPSEKDSRYFTNNNSAVSSSITFPGGLIWFKHIPKQVHSGISLSTSGSVVCGGISIYTTEKTSPTESDLVYIQGGTWAQTGDHSYYTANVYTSPGAQYYIALRVDLETFGDVVLNFYAWSGGDEPVQEGLPTVFSLGEYTDKQFTTQNTRSHLSTSSIFEVNTITVDPIPTEFTDIELIGSEAKYPKFDVQLEVWNSNLTRKFPQDFLVMGSRPQWVNWIRSIENVPEDSFEYFDIYGDYGYGTAPTNVYSMNYGSMMFTEVYSPYSSSYNNNYMDGQPIWVLSGSKYVNREENGYPYPDSNWFQGWAYSFSYNPIGETSMGFDCSIATTFEWRFRVKLWTKNYESQIIYALPSKQYRIVPQPMLRANTGSLDAIFTAAGIATDRKLEIRAYCPNNNNVTYSSSYIDSTDENGRVSINCYNVTNRAIYNGGFGFNSSDLERLPVYVYLVAAGSDGGYSTLSKVIPSFSVESLDSRYCEIEFRDDLPMFEGTTVKCIKFTDTYYFDDVIVTPNLDPITPLDPYRYIAPSVYPESGQVHGFASYDFTGQDSSSWIAGLPTSGPAASGRVFSMSDDGMWILGGMSPGSYSNPPRINLFKYTNTSSEGYDLIFGNDSQGINLMGYVVISLPTKFNQISRDGKFVAKVQDDGGNIKSVLGYYYGYWEVDANNPNGVILINSAPAPHTYTFGRTVDGKGIIGRVSDRTTQIVDDMYGDPVGVNYFGNKVIDASNSDPDNRYVLYTKDMTTGLWSHDGGFFQANTVTGQTDAFWPIVNGMSGDASIAVGATDRNSGKAIYWRLTDPIVGGVREAIALPELADSATYGTVAMAEGISSDGTVIVGRTQAYYVYWTGPNFDTCHLLSTTLTNRSTGLNWHEKIYDNATQAVIPEGYYNLAPDDYDLAQVGFQGRFVTVLGHKEGPNFQSIATSMIFAAPTTPLNQ